MNDLIVMNKHISPKRGKKYFTVKSKTYGGVLLFNNIQQ